MSEKKTGGPAFPVENVGGGNTEKGMTLRDYFAGQALLMCPKNAYEFEESAEWCYKMADAMIRAKEAGE